MPTQDPSITTSTYLQSAASASAIILALSLSACVSTEQQADGSTRVRLSASDAGQTPAPQQAAKAPLLMPAAPPAPLLSTTPLAGLFAKHPSDGTRKTYYPRVALTIVDWSRADCWTAKAKIWRSKSKSENVAPFAVCFNDQPPGVALQNTADMQLFQEQRAREHSGKVRTEGPKAPKLAVPEQQPTSTDQAQSHLQPFVQQLVAGTGWKAGAPMNFWIVGFKAQPVAVAGKAPAALNLAALKDLQHALECQPMKNLTTSLQALGMASDGKLFDAPPGLKAFGLPLAKVGFHPEAGQGESISTAVFASGVSFERMRKAAALKLDKTAIGSKPYTRFTKVGMLTSVQDASAGLKLACSPNVES